jgi:hypothetical protein
MQKGEQKTRYEGSLAFRRALRLEGVEDMMIKNNISLPLLKSKEDGIHQRIHRN